jgi:hypothetical protein
MAVIVAVNEEMLGRLSLSNLIRACLSLQPANCDAPGSTRTTGFRKYRVATNKPHFVDPSMHHRGDANVNLHWKRFVSISSKNRCLDVSD